FACNVLSHNSLASSPCQGSRILSASHCGGACGTDTPVCACIALAFPCSVLVPASSSSCSSVSNEPLATSVCGSIPRICSSVSANRSCAALVVAILSMKLPQQLFHVWNYSDSRLGG